MPQRALLLAAAFALLNYDVYQPAGNYYEFFYLFAVYERRDLRIFFYQLFYLVVFHIDGDVQLCLYLAVYLYGVFKSVFPGKGSRILFGSGVLLPGDFLRSRKTACS